MTPWKSSSRPSPVKKAGAVISKTLRRLFGRELPAGEANVAADNKTGASTTTDDVVIVSSLSSRCSVSQSSLDNHQTANITGENPSADVQAQAEVERRPSEAGKHQPATTQAEESEAPHPREITPTTMPGYQKDLHQHDKENRPPQPVSLDDAFANLKLSKGEAPVAPSSPAKPAAPALPDFSDPAVVAERAMHMKFIGEALEMARLALRTNETPVGCVLVHRGKIIAKGMNATNVTRNGTRHAELMALSALLSRAPSTGPRTTSLLPKVSDSSSDDSSSVPTTLRCPDEGNEDGKKGHLYPYGQKFHPASEVDPSIILESILYVTVEPCVMCASLLRQMGIKKVYFGAVNDKFGGTGGVFSIHANSLPVGTDGQTASAHPMPKPTQLPDGSGTLGVSFPPGGGDGGNLEAGYEIEGGWGRDEAVALLRRFYVQENGRAPMPRKKEGRAARLAAMMDNDEDPSTISNEDDTESDV